MNTRTRNLLKNLIPASLSYGFLFLLSVVDGIIIGRGAGSTALGGVSLATPFIYITSACIMLVCSGGGTVAAVAIGSKDDDYAQSVFMHSVVLSILAGLAVLLPGVLFSTQIARLLGADETYLEMTSVYIFWWAVFAIFESLSFLLQTYLRMDESQVFVAVVSGIGTTANIVLDILMVFVFHKGVMGAAIASGISQFLTFFIGFIYFLIKKGRFRLRRFAFHISTVKEILYRGFPAALTQLGPMFILASMNIVLLKYIGVIGIDSFAIISYVASFAVSCFLGSSQGLEPVLGKSYGEKNEKDTKWYFKSGMLYNVIVSICIILIILPLREPLCMLFGASGETLNYAADNMWKFYLGVPFMGINSMISTYLYATEKSGKAIFFNILSNFVLNTAAILLLPRFFGGGIIFYSSVIYQIILIFIGFIIIKSGNKETA